MSEGTQTSFYEIWFEHGVFITPGPRFARLEDAVEHARQMVQSRPEMNVSIRFPSTPTDTLVRAKRQVAAHAVQNGRFDDYHDDDVFDVIDSIVSEADTGNTERLPLLEEACLDELHPAYDGDTSPYGEPNVRNSEIQARTMVMNSKQLKQKLKKLG